LLIAARRVLVIKNTQNQHRDKYRSTPIMYKLFHREASRYRKRASRRVGQADTSRH